MTEASEEARTIRAGLLNLVIGTMGLPIRDTVQACRELEDYINVMSHYFTQRTAPARADWDDCYPLIPDIHVPDHRPIDTGLIDIRGDAIMRAPNPIGFGRDGEW